MEPAPSSEPLRSTPADELQHPSATPGRLEALLESHAGLLLSYIERHLPALLQPAHQPVDVLQDVYFEAFRRLGEFEPRGDDAAYRWLVTIARHRMCRLLRRHRALKRGGGRRPAQFWIPDDDDSTVDLLSQLATHRRSPSASAAAHELIGVVERALGGLSEDHREVVRLRHLEGLSVRETAARMGRTEGAAEMLCARALAALRKEMKSISMYA
jgi:RNA polymerase sigma-70 factor (ECF subfamily)